MKISTPMKRIVFPLPFHSNRMKCERSSLKSHDKGIEISGYLPKCKSSLGVCSFASIRASSRLPHSVAPDILSWWILVSNAYLIRPICECTPKWMISCLIDCSQSCPISSKEPSCANRLFYGSYLRTHQWGMVPLFAWLANTLNY